MAKPPAAPVAPGTMKVKKTRTAKVRSAEATALIAEAKANMKSAIALAKIIDPVKNLDSFGCDKLAEAIEARKVVLATPAE